MYRGLNLCIATRKVDKIEETLKILIEGQSYWIKIKEIPSENIVDGCQRVVNNQSHSQDYSLNISDDEPQSVFFPGENQNSPFTDMVNDKGEQGNASENTHIISINIQETKVEDVRGNPTVLSKNNTETWRTREKNSTDSSNGSGLNSTSLDHAYHRATQNSDQIDQSKKSLGLSSKKQF